MTMTSGQQNTPAADTPSTTRTMPSRAATTLVRVAVRVQLVPVVLTSADLGLVSRTHSLASPSLSPRAGNESMHTCLFLPYLHFDSYKNLIRRRELILQRVGHGRAHPVPDSVAKSDSVEMQVIWEFLGHDPPLNCRRTLDQYGYPSLRDTRSRDDDQMLYKLTKDRMYLSGHQRDLYSHWSSSQAGWDKIDGGSWRQPVLDRDNDADDDDCDDDDDRKPEDKVLNGNVLMVDQMWLWALNSRSSTCT